MEWPAPLTVHDVSAELGCSEDEVRALIREGELRTVACGIRPALVPRHELDDYLRRLRVKQKRLSGRDELVAGAERPQQPLA
jgi:excisionase family DNA binding protein